MGVKGPDSLKGGTFSPVSLNTETGDFVVYLSMSGTQQGPRACALIGFLSKTFFFFLLWF